MRFLNYFFRLPSKEKKKPLSQIWVFVIAGFVTQEHTRTHTHTLFHSLSLLHTHTTIVTGWWFLPQAVSLTHTFTLTLSLSQSLSHKHTLTLSLSLFHNFVYCNYMPAHIEWDAESEVYFLFNDNLTKVISLFVRCNSKVDMASGKRCPGFF